MNILLILLKFLNKKQKISATILLVIILLTSIIETLSIAIIFPVIKLIVGADLNIELNFMNTYAEKFINTGISNPENLLIYTVLFGLIFIFLLKAFLLSFSNWFQFRFINKVDINWVTKLFKRYISYDYSFHLKNNSAILLRNLNQCTVAANSLKIVITLLSEFLILLSIVALLIFIDYKLSIILFVIFLLIFSTLYLLTKDKLKKLGTTKHIHDGLVIKNIQQGFGGIKDIKVKNSENFFIESLNKNKQISNYSHFVKEFIISLPRIWIETALILGIVIFLLFNVFTLKQNLNLIAVLGTFTAAAFRIMPSLNRMITSFQTLRFNLPAIKNISSELIKPKKLPKDVSEKIKVNFKNINFKKKLLIENLKFKYENKDTLALNKLNLDINVGDSIGIFGQSGSGKSTLIDVLLGILKPTSGTIKVDDIDTQSNLISWQKNISYVPQKIYLTDDTIKNNIAFGKPENEINYQLIKKVLKISELDDFVENLPMGINTEVGERGVRISGGQLQRIGIARAFYSMPKILILDESTNALDIETEDKIMECIFNQKDVKTLIIISHRENTIKKCNKIFEMKNGLLIKNE
jgi:ATP-binding cassette, subfamily B, bacterial PglK